MKQTEWVGRDEYPQDKDMDTFGEKSSWDDDDDLTYGYIGKRRPRFWTLGRIGVAIVMLALLGSILVPLLSPLLR